MCSRLFLEWFFRFFYGQYSTFCLQGLDFRDSTALLSMQKVLYCFFKIVDVGRQ